MVYSILQCLHNSSLMLTDIITPSELYNSVSVLLRIVSLC